MPDATTRLISWFEPHNERYFAHKTGCRVSLGSLRLEHEIEHVRQRLLDELENELRYPRYSLANTKPPIGDGIGTWRCVRKGKRRKHF